jgi:uncharacterized protein (TIGR03067 family)
MLQQRRWCLCVVAVLAAGWAPVPKGKSKAELAKEELKKLQGEWEEVQVSYDGGPWQKGRSTHVYKGDRLSCVYDGRVATRWTVALDPSREPKAMDKKDGKGVHLRCSYKLHGDELTVASGDIAGIKGYPKKVVRQKGAWVKVFKRIKKKP